MNTQEPPGAPPLAQTTISIQAAPGGAAGPGASVPGAALGGPPGAHAGARATWRRDLARYNDHRQGTAGPSRSLPIVQLAVTASKPPCGVSLRDGCASLDEATTHQDSAPTRGRWRDSTLPAIGGDTLTVTMNWLIRAILKLVDRRTAPVTSTTFGM